MGVDLACSLPRARFVLNEYDRADLNTRSTPCIQVRKFTDVVLKELSRIEDKLSQMRIRRDSFVHYVFG